MAIGKVWLVGAGPGDIGLMTKKGEYVLSKADVVVYDALVSNEVLGLIPTSAECINAGKRAGNHTIPQQQINAILLDKAKEGKQVVRLKGGDPFVFGRGGEELELLLKENIPFEVVSGITSSIAVPAYNGIAVTHRDYTSSLHIITGHKKKDGELDINYRALTELDGTLVFLMGRSSLGDICDGLIEAGMDKNMPAAILQSGTTYMQKKVVAAVSTLEQKADEYGIKSPAVIVVGKVCEKDFSWYDKKPLFGTQIIVTRPKTRASALTERLRGLGADVIELPSIETSAKFGSIEDIKSIADNDNVCIAFTSPSGVEHFFEILAQNKYDIRQILSIKNLKVAALGSATAKILEKYGIYADFIPERYSSKDLGRLLVQSLDKDTKLYLLRAENGSRDIIDELDGSDLCYRDIAIYSTSYIKNSALAQKTMSELENGNVDYVTFTSASTVDGFVKRFDGLDFTGFNAVCIGEKTAEEAKKHNMKIMVSSQATIDSMIDSILEDKTKNEKRNI